MEIQFPFSLTSLFLFLFFLILLINRRSKTHNPKHKLPPGPWKLPFIGNLHQLVGSLPHHSLRRLAQKYGPIMHLQIGELSTIVISSPRVAEIVLKTNGLAFVDRPEALMAKILFYNSADIGTSQYGEYWRQVRKLFILELLSMKKVQSFYTIMEEEVSRLVSSIRSSEGVAINLSEKFVSVTSTITCRAAVGRSRNDVQESITKLAKEAASYAGVLNAGDIFPSLSLLDSLLGSKRKLVQMHKKIDVLLEDIIREHEENRLKSESGGSTTDGDTLDVLLHLKEADEYQGVITRDCIKANIFEMFTGGTDTSGTLLEWAMAEMMKNPRVMEKAQTEVRQAFREKDKMSVTDIQKLNYLKMVIKETLRLHPPLPMVGPRRCREQCKIDGYDIPNKAICLLNAWAIGRDPEYWQDPETFEPERFSNIATTFTGNHFELIPFGGGRRVCPGMSFGLASVELTLSQLLYHFDWKLPNGISPQEFDMTEKFGATAGRKNSLYLIPRCCVLSEG